MHHAQFIIATSSFARKAGHYSFRFILFISGPTLSVNPHHPYFKKSGTNVEASSQPKNSAGQTWLRRNSVGLRCYSSLHAFVPASAIALIVTEQLPSRI